MRIRIVLGIKSNPRNKFRSVGRERNVFVDCCAARVTSIRLIGRLWSRTRTKEREKCATCSPSIYCVAFCLGYAQHSSIWITILRKFRFNEIRAKKKHHRYDFLIGLRSGASERHIGRERSATPSALDRRNEKKMVY